MQDLVETLTDLLKQKNWTMSTAESCTGGLLSAAITHRPGASSIFERGFITYSNESKTDILKVPEALIRSNGAVSDSCAEAMARGALTNSKANIALSITGIAGPEGGTTEKPVGRIHLGYAIKNGNTGSKEYNLTGSREKIRSQTVQEALKLLITLLKKQ